MASLDADEKIIDIEKLTNELEMDYCLLLPLTDNSKAIDIENTIKLILMEHMKKSKRNVTVSVLLSSSYMNYRIYIRSSS